MRLVKMLGLVAVVAMAATVFVGATSATARSTQLCNDHDSLVCVDDPTRSFSVLGSGRLLSSLVTVICDHIHGDATALALANPQVLHVEVEFLSCESGGGDHCLVTLLQALANLLKTGLDSGTLTITGGSFKFECDDVIFSTDIDCTYDGTGFQLAVGAQHLTADDTQIDVISGSLCPDESFYDALLKTTSNIYVLA